MELRAKIFQAGVIWNIQYNEIKNFGYHVKFREVKKWSVIDTYLLWKIPKYCMQSNATH